MEVYRRKRNCKFKSPGMDEFTRKRFTYRLGSRGFSLKVAPFCILALKSEHVHSHLYYFLLSVTCKEVRGRFFSDSWRLGHSRGCAKQRKHRLSQRRKVCQKVVLDFALEIFPFSSIFVFRYSNQYLQNQMRYNRSNHQVARAEFRCRGRFFQRA